MAKSISEKLKGVFNMSRNKKNADVNANTGFNVLNDAQEAISDENTDVLDGLDTPEEKLIVEDSEASESISEKAEEIAPKTVVKTEKTHEKVSRIAAEMNTKGYGL